MNFPLRALGILFSGPKMIALAFFPGAFTFFLSSVITYGLWALALQATTLWISLPVMMLSFLLSWLVIGNLSLLPVEDLIVDECQKSLWGEVRLKPLPLSAGRIFGEIRFSLFMGFMAIFLFVMSFIPVVGALAFVGTSWITAYSFMGLLYSRQDHPSRLKAFFEHPLSNFMVGFFINLLLFVPLVNVFLLGYAQIFAALVFLDRKKKVA